MNNTFKEKLFSIIQQHYAQEERSWVLQHVLEFVCKKPLAHIIATDFALTQLEQKQVFAIIDQHSNQHKPFAYIFGEVDFLQLNLKIEPPILIPRPETEEWVEQLIQVLMPYTDKSLNILDIGTGSGCIALSIAKQLPLFNITAVDISQKALALAQQNAERNNIHNVSFVQSDLFANIDDKDFDCIISNPPYISKHEYDALDASVKDWEDVNALYAPNEGFALIERLIQEAPKHLVKRYNDIPQLVIEFGYKQAAGVQEIAQQSLFKKCVMYKDFCGKDRLAYLYL